MFRFEIRHDVVRLRGPPVASYWPAHAFEHAFIKLSGAFIKSCNASGEDLLETIVIKFSVGRENSVSTMIGRWK